MEGRGDLARDGFEFAGELSLAGDLRPVRGALAMGLALSRHGTTRALVLPAGSAEEVGGANGLAALKRLQNVVRRVADQWRPAAANEAYHIVKQRLFTQPDAAALAAINATARGFVDLYRKYPGDFPRESREVALDVGEQHGHAVRDEHREGGVPGADEGVARFVKSGPVLDGWAEIRVRPTASGTAKPSAAGSAPVICTKRWKDSVLRMVVCQLSR